MKLNPLPSLTWLTCLFFSTPNLPVYLNVCLFPAIKANISYCRVEQVSTYKLSKLFQNGFKAFSLFKQ